MTLKTQLLSGAGNTFHIAYAPRWDFSPKQWTLLKMRGIAKHICKKNKADGFIFMEEISADQYKWFFFNKDGSDAEMCGNATRCVGYYIKNILKSGASRWSLVTTAGVVQIELTSTKSASKNFTELFLITTMPLRLLRSDKGFYCDTGVPHLVVEKNSITIDENLRSEAKELRQHTEFSPRGTNVTFVKLLNETNKVQAVSYERGVENFTAACGTGAMAAAYFN